MSTEQIETYDAAGYIYTLRTEEGVHHLLQTEHGKGFIASSAGIDPVPEGQSWAAADAEAARLSDDPEALTRYARLTVNDAHREEVLHERERRDMTTGLLGKRAWFADVRHFVQGAREQGKEGAILLIDLDHFKEVNDNYGHPLGDQLLLDIGTALQANIRDASRLGGDEFAVLARFNSPSRNDPAVPLDRRGRSDLTAQQKTENLAARTREVIDEVLAVYRSRYDLPRLGVTIAYATMSPELSFEDFLKTADDALKSVKEANHKAYNKQLPIYRRMFARFGKLLLEVAGHDVSRIEV